ncbi:MAG: transcription termination factor NusA [Victivallales bacterium]|nr:transcription termination factor NusA [Victivallales bacterium]
MNKELLDGLTYLEHERGIDRESLITLLEESMLDVLKNSTPFKRELTVSIDRKTCEISSYAKLIVADPVEDPSGEISLAAAQKRFPQAKVGDEVTWTFDDGTFGRIAAQTVRTKMIQKLRTEERRSQCGQYKDQVGQLIHGEVKHISKDGVTISFNSVDGYLPREERIPGENFEIGELVTVLLTDVDPERSGPALTVSRRHPDFVRRLFEREVTEISNGTVEIRGLAREAGFRTKIAVSSNEPRIDPMGACVGVRGSRVRNIVHELGGEKVDIIEYSDDIATYIANALKPARLNEVKVNQAKKEVVVNVDEDQLSLAIGKKGQNTRLATRLTGWRIEIIKIRHEEAPANDMASMMKRAIDVVSSLEGVSQAEAETLVSNGFVSLEDIVAAEEYIDAMATLPGFDLQRAKEIIAAAKDAMNG